MSLHLKSEEIEKDAEGVFFFIKSVHSLFRDL